MNEPEIVAPDTVIRLTDNRKLPDVGQTFIGQDASKVAGSVFSDRNNLTSWTSGVSCKVLSPGGQWIQGRVKFVLQFTPTEQPSDPTDVQ
ncbi:hypothetical protein Lepto7375DRAFT_4593 [Leptolyngbya sp. PCC 7375]|nr:hypothetical protein Lepto7375DRAFT_4593 [Leptolyngbya sp. PCC 7375]